MEDGDTERWDITVKTDRGAPLDTTDVLAKTRDEAVEKVSGWSVYEVRLKTELGGATWTSVFAPSEGKAREEAFEESTAYVDVLDVESYDRPFRVRGERNSPQDSTNTDREDS